MTMTRPQQKTKWFYPLSIAAAAVLLFILLVSTTTAEELIITSGVTTHEPFYSDTLTYRTAQSFQSSSSISITGFKLEMGVSTANAGSSFQFSLRKNSFLGNPLAWGEVSKANINNSQANFFNFVTPFTIDASYPYIIYLNCTSCSTGLYTYDSNNTNPYTDGYVLFSSNAGSTWTNYSANHDLVMTIIYQSASIGVKPSLTLLSDLKNGSVTNATSFNFYLNGTSINNSNNYSCQIFENTTLKNSFVNQDISISKNLSFSLVGNYERYLNFSINCHNENASSNLSALYYIDNIKSVLNYAFPNGTYTNTNPLYTNFSITDTNLYAFEWLVYQGATLKENITHIGITPPNYKVYNISAVSQIIGNYNFILNVYENHNPLSTSDLFKEYDIVKNDNELIFKDPDKSDISYSVISKEDLDVKTETKDLKQYFEYVPLAKEAPKFYTYYVKYPGDLTYLKDSRYKGHFVMWDIKKYIDFQCKDYVKVIKENDNLYRIETPCTKFETTGNLNQMTFYGNFSIITPPSLSDGYLLSINETITKQSNLIIVSINNIYGVLSMLGYFIFAGVLLYLGMKFVSETLLIIGGGLTGMIGFYVISLANNDLIQMGFGMILLIGSAIMLINVFIFDRNVKKLGN